MKTNTHIAISLISLFSVITVQAATTIIPSTADAGIRASSAGDGFGTGSPASGIVIQPVADSLLQTGRGASGLTSVTVLPFLLPTLGVGESFANATLTFTVGEDKTLDRNIDLYGLGYRAAATVLSQDFYVGASTTAHDTTDATLIMENAYTIGAVMANNTSYTLSPASLTTYLNNQYLAGAAGDYVFLRFSSDTFTDGQRLVIHSADSTGGGGTYKPKLTFDVVPEPSAALLGTLAALALLRRRR